MELLQVSGMNDVTFTVGDIVTLLGLIIGLVGVFVKMKIDRVKLEGTVNTLEAKHAEFKEDFIASKRSRHAIRKEFAEADDKIMNELKEDREKNGKEFKEINGKLANIDTGVAEIKGLLSK